MFDLAFLDLVQIGLLIVTCIVCYIAGKINGAANIVSELVNDKIVTLDRLERWANSKDNE